MGIMNKNRLCFPILIVSLLLILVSCGSKTPEIVSDIYNFGQDHQFYMVTEYTPRPKMQELENGCVFLHQGYIYSYEQGGSILPLCSKPNCLHDKETDPEKRQECSAYLNGYSGFDGDVSLMLYKDHLYVYYSRNDYMLTEDDEGSGCIVRISLDGTAKDFLLEKIDIDFPLIHRGYLYYYESRYDVETAAEKGRTDDEKNIENKVSMYRVNLEKRPLKEELCYQPEKAHGMTRFSAYGSDLYFQLILNNGLELQSCKYNVEDKKVTVLSDIKPAESPVNRSYMLVGGKWFFIEYDNTKDNAYPVTLYETDILGGEKKAVLADYKQGNQLSCDGKYYYVNNVLVSSGNPETELEYRVYDKDFHLVDTFKMPESDTYPYGAPIGGEKYQYLKFYKGDEWGLYIWDKSDIGSLKGDSYPQEKIVYAGGTDDPERSDTASDDGTKTKASESVNEDISDEYVCPLKEFPKEPADEARAIQNEDDAVECQVSFTNDEADVRISVPEDYIIGSFTENGEIIETVLVSETIELEGTLYGYYSKGNDVYVRKLSFLEKSDQHQKTFRINLPEDGETFIGVTEELDFKLEQVYNTEEGIEKGKTPYSTYVTYKLINARAGRVR